MPAGKGAPAGRASQAARARPPLASGSGAGRRASGEEGALGGGSREARVPGQGWRGWGDGRGPGAGLFTSESPPGRRLPPGLPIPPLLGRALVPPASPRRGLAAPGFGGGSRPWRSRGGAAPGARAAQVSRPGPALRAASRCGCCAAVAARVASVGPLNFYECSVYTRKYHRSVLPSSKRNQELKWV